LASNIFTNLCGLKYIKAGFKKELAAIEDPEERQKFYNQMVAGLYQRGQALNMASYLEIDAVIDPADTRKWIMHGLKSAPPDSGHRPCHAFVDPW